MLKLDPETAKVPVIVCSADARLLRQRQKQILEEMDCYVDEKPFDLDTLLSAIDEALAGSQDPLMER